VLWSKNSDQQTNRCCKTTKYHQLRNKNVGFYIQIIGNFIGFEKMTQIVSGDFEKIMTDSENNQ